MLFDTIKYSALLTKIKALESRLLTSDDFHELAAQRDVFTFGYKLFENPKLSQYTEEMQMAISGGRIPLEKSLLESLYKDFSRFFSFVTDIKTQKYLDILFLKYEIDLLKEIIKNIFDERTVEVSSSESVRIFSDRIKVDITKLSISKNIAEFVNNLSGTKFFPIIKKINIDNASSFEFETQLDFYYFSQSWKYLNNNLKGSEKVSQKKILGSDIDLRNIIYIYRFKNFYKIDENQIYTYLIPIKYKLNNKILKDLVIAPSNESFFEVLKDTPYKNVFNEINTKSIEKCYKEFIYKVNISERNKNPYSINSLTTYLFLKGEEVLNLVTLTECIRYGLKPEISLGKLNFVKRGDILNG